MKHFPGFWHSIANGWGVLATDNWQLATDRLTEEMSFGENENP
jgi:hypothetical protein